MKNAWDIWINENRQQHTAPATKLKSIKTMPDVPEHHAMTNQPPNAVMPAPPAKPYTKTRIKKARANFLGDTKRLRKQQIQGFGAKSPIRP